MAAAFRGQQLTWTVNDAVRVLAEVDPPEVPAPVRIDAGWAPDRGWSGPPRLPKLPKRKPAMAQLSLFD